MAGIGCLRHIFKVPVGIYSLPSRLLSQATCISYLQPLSSVQSSTSRLNLIQHEKRFFSTLQHEQTDKSGELFTGNDPSTEVAEAIGTQLKTSEAGRLFAVVHVSGKQRKVTVEDVIILDKPIAAKAGERIRLNKVLLVGGKDFTLVGRPILSSNVVRVEATVIEKTLSHTKIMFWYHKRQNHRVFRLHKDALTMLRINDIDILGLESGRS